MNVTFNITLNYRHMDFAKGANCKFTASQLLDLLVLFPFFAIKNSLNFAGSVLDQMIVCKKRHVIQVHLQRGHQPVAKSICET